MTLSAQEVAELEAYANYLEAQVNELESILIQVILNDEVSDE